MTKYQLSNQLDLNTQNRLTFIYLFIYTSNSLQTYSFYSSASSFPRSTSRTERLYLTSQLVKDRVLKESF